MPILAPFMKIMMLTKTMILMTLMMLAMLLTFHPKPTSASDQPLSLSQSLYKHKEWGQFAIGYQSQVTTWFIHSNVNTKSEPPKAGQKRWILNQPNIDSTTQTGTEWEKNRSLLWKLSNPLKVCLRTTFLLPAEYEILETVIALLIRSYVKSPKTRWEQQSSFVQQKSSVLLMWDKYITCTQNWSLSVVH